MGAKSYRKLAPIGSNMNDAAYPFRGCYGLPPELNHGHSAPPYRGSTAIEAEGEEPEAGTERTEQEEEEDLIFIRNGKLEKHPRLLAKILHCHGSLEERQRSINETGKQATMYTSHSSPRGAVKRKERYSPPRLSSRKVYHSPQDMDASSSVMVDGADHAYGPWKGNERETSPHAKDMKRRRWSTGDEKGPVQRESERRERPNRREGVAPFAAGQWVLPRQWLGEGYVDPLQPLHDFPLVREGDEEAEVQEGKKRRSLSSRPPGALVPLRRVPLRLRDDERQQKGPSSLSSRRPLHVSSSHSPSYIRLRAPPPSQQSFISFSVDGKEVFPENGWYYFPLQSVDVAIALSPKAQRLLSFPLPLEQEWRNRESISDEPYFLPRRPPLPLRSSSSDNQNMRRASRTPSGSRGRSRTPAGNDRGTYAVTSSRERRQRGTEKPKEGMRFSRSRSRIPSSRLCHASREDHFSANMRSAAARGKEQRMGQDEEAKSAAGRQEKERTKHRGPWPTSSPFTAEKKKKKKTGNTGGREKVGKEHSRGHCRRHWCSLACWWWAVGWDVSPLSLFHFLHHS